MRTLHDPSSSCEALFSCGRYLLFTCPREQTQLCLCLEFRYVLFKLLQDPHKASSMFFFSPALILQWYHQHRSKIYQWNQVLMALLNTFYRSIQELSAQLNSCPFSPIVLSTYISSHANLQVAEFIVFFYWGWGWGQETIG